MTKSKLPRKKIIRMDYERPASPTIAVYQRPKNPVAIQSRRLVFSVCQNPEEGSNAREAMDWERAWLELGVTVTDLAMCFREDCERNLELWARKAFEC